MEKTKDSYIEENRWFITASKLKCFIKSPEDFFLRYIKEEDTIDERDKKHLTIGTAIDDLISYWENAFFKKYFIDEWLLKPELEQKLFEMWIDSKGLKVEDMKALVYWDTSEKIRLTPGEGKEVLSCVNELKRQPLFDVNWLYDCQKTFIWKYKSLQLKGTLDRVNQEMIRDTKSTANISKFLWDWKESLWYDVSMCFYWILVLKATGEKKRLVFDVVQKSFPYPAKFFEIPQWEIMNVVEQTIIPALDKLDEMMTKWEETKDESIWQKKWNPFDDLSSCEMYPIMKTALQENFEILQ